MSAFTDNIVRLMEKGKLEEFEEKLLDMIDTAQKVLDDEKELHALYAAQGAKKLGTTVLELPDDILSEDQDEQ